MQSVYEAAGGSEGLVRLGKAWHMRVLADEIVGHAFSRGFHPQHTERLAAYWAEALGGPATYSGSYGNETSVVRMHSGNGPHEEMDRQAIACFDQALDDVGLSATEPVRQVLRDYFTWATTTTMSRYQETAEGRTRGSEHPAVVMGRTATLKTVGAACHPDPVVVVFAAELWMWNARRGDSWTFVSLPAEASEEIQDLVSGPRRGFGSLRVRATIGGNTWKTSIFPDSAHGTYALPIKRAIREAEALQAGDVASVTVELIDL